jgi:type IX secretion system PorP/SprF family membrane protein
LGLPLTLLAQQDPQFSQYMFNQLYLNPAVAGADPRYIEFVMIHRSQWTGYSGSFDDGGAPTTQAGSINMPLHKYRLGTGLQFVNDQLGPVTNQEVRLSLAYHIPLKKAQLSIGLRGGIYNHVIDFDQLRFVDPNDPLELTGKQSEFTSDFGFGMYFKPNSGQYYIGASINHLTKSNFDYGTGITYNSLEQHYSILGGFNYDLSSSVVLSPSVIVKTDLNSFSSEVSLLSTLNNKFYVGVSFRGLLESAIIMGGVNLMKDNRLRIGAAFDYTVLAKNAKEQTSHEIMLTYRLPGFQSIVSPIIRTPRFRIE